MTKKPENRIEKASKLLASMANTKRLVVLTNLAEGEKSVGHLAEIVGLTSGALSQHLGKMRTLGLVETRRDGQTIYYRLISQEVRVILRMLHRLYGRPRIRKG